MVAFLLGIVAVAGIVYGLDMFAPQVAIKWQVRSTERAGGLRNSVGEGFGAAVNRGSSEPWNDRSTRMRVRVIGACLVLMVAGLVATHRLYEQDMTVGRGS